ncbi:MAG: hypothetical protein QOD98_4627 [Nocardioidaceae bacterium]|jgi:hypothetical protein|nr:hypothetical protein [Nocardioidaceae bacterium]
MPSSSAPSATSATSVIEGRWEQEHTCQQLVDALDAAGLAALAPGVVGDYFPDRTPQQLARKANVCSGAQPQRHAHFFTSDGAFGSLDQHGQQVDDGPYEVSGDTLTIAEGEFHYSVDGDTLVLEPVIREADRQSALADPLEFSTAGWQVSVAYDGLAFTRVPCDGWC